MSPGGSGDLHLGAFIQVAIRECHETFARRDGVGTAPDRAALEVALVRCAYSILLRLERCPADLLPLLLPGVLRTVLLAGLQSTQELVQRERWRLRASEAEIREAEEDERVRRELFGA